MCVVNTSVVHDYHDICKRIMSATAIWVYAPLQKRALIISSIPLLWWVHISQFMSFGLKTGGLSKLKFLHQFFAVYCNLWWHFSINVFNVKVMKCLTGLAPSAQQLVNERLSFLKLVAVLLLRSTTFTRLKSYGYT